MADIRVPVPDHLREEMEAHPEVPWDVVLRRAIEREVERLHAAHGTHQVHPLSEEELQTFVDGRSDLQANLEGEDVDDVVYGDVDDP